MTRFWFAAVALALLAGSGVHAQDSNYDTLKPKSNPQRPKYLIDRLTTAVQQAAPPTQAPAAPLPGGVNVGVPAGPPMQSVPIPPATPPAPGSCASDGCASCASCSRSREHDHGDCWAKLIAFFTYCPRHNCACKCEPCCPYYPVPPVYTYFFCPNVCHEGPAPTYPDCHKSTWKWGGGASGGCAKSGCANGGCANGGCAPVAVQSTH
jgi:hypothetical protein